MAVETWYDTTAGGRPVDNSTEDVPEEQPEEEQPGVERESAKIQESIANSKPKRNIWQLDRLGDYVSK